ncbi:MAG: hypothetical protein HQM16_12855 [Deltaproteobacteria bacterium]|nr:hypothetical protein [Deltaproteobacteria bacterium]
MKNVIEAFDEYLHKQKIKFTGTIIGGAALIVLGIVDRKTRDVDCLDPSLPLDVKKASVDFAKKFNKTTHETPLIENWFNNGPQTLKRDLPKDWQKRAVTFFKGQSLNLKTLGRQDLLLSKLFAYCDRQADLNDCLALKPTLAELKSSYEWVVERDANPIWPRHVKNSFEFLAKELGYEFKP